MEKVKGPAKILDDILARLDADPTNADLLLELIGLENTIEFAPQKWNSRLGEAQASAVARCLFDHGGKFDDPDFAWMLVEHVCDHLIHPQTKASLLGWILSCDPNNREAFDWFIQHCLDEDYLHRGTDLAQIAGDLDDLKLAARYTLYDALVTYLVTGVTRWVGNCVRLALMLDPNVDYEGIRQDCEERSGRKIPFPTPSSWLEKT